jgi:hypothetical protein
MAFLKMFEIIYEAYELAELTNRLYQGINILESFNGILIESYYGIFCYAIITPFGKIKVNNGNDDKVISDYIRSRITYRVVLEKIFNKNVGCIGPFYLVTHIDGVPIEQELVDMTHETFFEYIIPNKNGREEYSAFILDCMNKKLIRDTEGIIDTLLFKPESYPDLVKYLAEGLESYTFANVLSKDTTIHIFSLLLRKHMIVF